jgi:hypothetical protein
MTYIFSHSRPVRNREEDLLNSSPLEPSNGFLWHLLFSSYNNICLYFKTEGMGTSFENLNAFLLISRDWFAKHLPERNSFEQKV